MRTLEECAQGQTLAGPAVSPAALANVAVVLVEPLYGGNVGAVARAMKNNGLSELVLVRPRQFRNEECEWMAKGATDILDTARTADSLPEALAPYHVTAATTRRLGRMRRPDFTPRQMARVLLPLAAANRIALVFGREDTGLTGEEVNLCQYVVHIPAAPAMPTLNLAQAVLVCCYELFQAATESPASSVRRLARAESLEGLYAHMEEALGRLGFLLGENPGHTMALLRRIFGRCELDERDVRVLRGVMRAIQNYMNVLEKRFRSGE